MRWYLCFGNSAKDNGHVAEHDDVDSLYTVSGASCEFLCLNFGFDHRIGHLWPLSMTAEFSNAPTSRAEVRVPRTDAAGMVDATIDALFPILSGASVLGLPTLALASLLQT